MIKPIPEDVEIFKDYTIADFQCWLRVGLEGYLLEDDVWSFEPMAVFINQDEHLTSDLHNIYEVLPYKLKAYFRQALANIIATLEADAKEVVVFEHLLLLASKISAGAEVLPVFPSRIGSGFFGLTKNSAGESLFDITMRTVADLAAPIENALICLHQLIGSRYFENAYAGTALLALCRVNPRGLADHLNLLREKLDAMFRQYDINKTGKRRWAERILQTVGMYALKEALNELKPSFPGSEDTSSDNWLLEALFDKIEGESPLVGFEIQSDAEIDIYEIARLDNKFTISSRNDPSASAESTNITSLQWVRPSPTGYLTKEEMFKQTEDSYEYVFNKPLNSMASVQQGYVGI